MLCQLSYRGSWSSDRLARYVEPLRIADLAVGGGVTSTF
jgi:hypothetical protein